MLLQSFYKQKPSVDTEYRELVILGPKGGLRVRLLGGTWWGPEHSKELRVIQANGFDEAKESFDKVFRQLEKEGWRAYSPYEQW